MYTVAKNPTRYSIDPPVGKLKSYRGIGMGGVGSSLDSRASTISRARSFCPFRYPSQWPSQKKAVVHRLLATSNMIVQTIETS
jgi:hypothetical protein